MNNSVSNKSFIASLFSPAVGLAILGTVAFVFSFYRAGQLAPLVLSKDSLAAVRQVHQNEEKIDVNSRALLIAIDSSTPVRLANAGDHERALNEVMKNLTNSSPHDVANIALAGDVLSTVGNPEQKQMGLALLAKAVAMVPNNHYLASRYATRMAANGDPEHSIKQLSDLVKNHPDLIDIHFILAKIYFIKNQSKEAVAELEKVKEGDGLSAKEKEEAALMFVKMGRTYDGYKLFRKAMSGNPSERYYASYCGDFGSSDEDYRVALSIIKANLANNPSANRLTLDIKHAVLLLLLNRSVEAKEVLETAVKEYKNNLDLQTLLTVDYFILGDSDKALSNLELAAKLYQPKL